MARKRFIEHKNGDSWHSVSDLFAQWILDNTAPSGLGWSEGDSIDVNNTLKLYCFSFPDRHGEKINYFEEWAKTTDRLFGAPENGRIKFPNEPDLVVVLPPEKESKIPPGLKLPHG